MAAVTAPAHVSVQHQKLLHFVGEGKWSDERVLANLETGMIGLHPDALASVSGGGASTTVTCTGGTTAHTQTGTDKDGNQFVTVKCY